MNEQIQQIINGNGTKTSKIQKLLALGLTRTEVARLVANGNYGFVQNVYAKMVRQHLWKQHGRVRPSFRKSTTPSVATSASR